MLNSHVMFQCKECLGNTVKFFGGVILNNSSGSVFGGSSFSRDGQKGMKQYP